MAKTETDDQNAPVEGAPKKGKRKSIAIIAGLMLGEGVAIFAAMSFIAPAPDPTLADETDVADNALNLDQETEVTLCEVDAFNRKEGKLHVYHMELSALVAKENVETVERFVKAREASIKDRIQEVIRSADPAHLNDPSLELVKRQIRMELNNLLGGEELIGKLLVAKMLQSRTSL